MNDIVNHPSHYVDGRKYEPKDVIRDWNLNFSLGNAVKYISRAGRKDASKTIEDLEKAIFYINDEIAALRNSEEELAQKESENAEWAMSFIKEYNEKYRQECEPAERSLFVTGLSITNEEEPNHYDTIESSGGDSYTLWASSEGEVTNE
ncbi:MAG: DUF3310 domain-containing protein [Bacteroidaceae bacterium]|nr:DUF3310 domain-containing protein [Bacteroidaceae bacterium]